MAFALAMKSKRGKRDRRPQSVSQRQAAQKSATESEGETSGEETSEEGTGERRLRLWRKHVGELRTQSNLFDMPLYDDQFTRLLQGTWELAHIARYKTAFQAGAAAGGIVTSMSKKRTFNSAFNAKKLFHLFSPVSNRYHSRDEFAVEPESPTASRRLHNRDQHGRLQVHQTYSEGSMISNAAALLEAGGDPHDAHKTSTDAGHTRPSPHTRAASSTTGTSASSSDTAARTSGAGYHQTGKGSTGGSVGQSSTAKKYPSIPRYVFDGRLIMLNIGACPRRSHPCAPLLLIG